VHKPQSTALISFWPIIDRSAACSLSSAFFCPAACFCFDVSFALTSWMVYFLVDVRVALVTGGNRGMGFEICRQLASGGLTVVLTARSETRGAEAVDRLRGLGLPDVVFHQLDITEPASAARLADFVRSKFGKLDVLVRLFRPPLPGFLMLLLTVVLVCIKLVARSNRFVLCRSTTQE